MKNFIKANKIQTILLLVAIIVSGIFVFSQFVLATSKVKTDYRTSVASTSPEYLLSSSGNTLTQKVDTYGIDQVDVNIQLIASSTDSVLNWYWEFSDDFVDWFREDLAQTASATNITHASSTLVHTWKPDTITTLRKNVGLSDIASRYTRIVFSATGDNVSVWARFALKENNF